MLIYVWYKLYVVGYRWKRDMRSGFKQENLRCVAVVFSVELLLIALSIYTKY